MPDMTGLREGNSLEWERAYFFLWPVAYSSARRTLPTLQHESIEDVAISAIQEAAQEVKDGRVTNFDQLKALTAVIARRRAVDHLRRLKAERRGSGVTEIIECRDDLISTAPNPLERVDAHDVADLLIELLRRLDETERKLLKSYYLDGLKQAELAERFGWPMGTVGVKLSRALESMRSELQKYPQLMKEFREILR